ncbi:unnamed protein product [Calypogeia fissa]
MKAKASVSIIWFGDDRPKCLDSFSRATPSYLTASGYSQVKRNAITRANYSYQRSQQSERDKKVHIPTEVFEAEGPFSGQAGS